MSEVWLPEVELEPLPEEVPPPRPPLPPSDICPEPLIDIATAPLDEVLPPFARMGQRELAEVSIPNLPIGVYFLCRSRNLFFRKLDKRFEPLGVPSMISVLRRFTPPEFRARFAPPRLPTVIFGKPIPEFPEIRVGARVRVVTSPDALTADPYVGKIGVVKDATRRGSVYYWVYTVQLETGEIIPRTKYSLERLEVMS